MTKSGNLHFPIFALILMSKLVYFMLCLMSKTKHFRFEIVKFVTIFEILDMSRVIRVIHDYTVRPFFIFSAVHFYSVTRKTVSNPNHDKISNLDFYQSRLDVRNSHRIDIFDF